MPELPNVVRLLRNGQQERKIRVHLGADAVLSGSCGRTAKFDYRRRIALGDGWQEAGRVQGRRQVLRLPVGHQSPGRSASEVGLLADYKGGLREDQGRRLLSEEPDPRDSAERTDQQGADRELTRPAL